MSDAKSNKVSYNPQLEIKSIFQNCGIVNIIYNKLGWAELNQAETVRLQVYAKLCFQM